MKKIKVTILRLFIGSILSIIFFYFIITICITLYMKAFYKKPFIIGNLKVRFCNEVFIPSLFLHKEIIKGKYPRYNSRMRYFKSSNFHYFLIINKWDDEKLDLKAYYSKQHYQKLDSLKVDDLWFYILNDPKRRGVFIVNYQLNVDFNLQRTFNQIFGDISIEEIKKIISGIKFELINKSVINI